MTLWKRIALAGATMVAAIAPVAALHAETWGVSLIARVPTMCTISYDPSGVGTAGNGVGLGALHEFCNAPAGYSLLVEYTPGSLRGATITAGEATVVLNGSGEAIISQSPVPRIRERALSATPGQNGFDTDRLNFRLVPR